MKLSFEKSTLTKNAADIVAVFVHQDKAFFTKEIHSLEKKIGVRVLSVKSGDFTGKPGESSIVYARQGVRTRRYLVVGLGKKAKATFEQYRRSAATAAKRARSLKARTLSMFISPMVPQFERTASALAEGAFLALYRYDKYITKKNDDPPPLEAISICAENPARLGEAEKAISAAQVICEATVLARDLANAPGNEIYPETLAEAASRSAERCGYSATILDEREIKDLGMGGVLGVSQGSTHPPRFIILEYGNKQRPPIVLVGKGVTFDTGGISIKPSGGMAEMKMDMSGAAAVIGAFEAVSRLKLKVHIVGLIPSVENMPSGSSIRPGDIIRHYNGKTSEVDNTDAEGRLILADALAYAEKYKPASVIDLATLTGACVVALGHHASGMMGNDISLMNRLKRAGETTFERVWQLPLYDEYEKLIRSDVADVKNVGGRWAGAITGGWFLKKFVGKHKWVHLDIAGTAMLEETDHYTEKGASGVGVRLLTEFLKRWG